MIIHLERLSILIKIFKLLKMETFLKIENIQLWARVGVLDKERELGQLFILDIFLWTDFEQCSVSDDIKKTVDYSKLVQILKDQSKKISVSYTHLTLPTKRIV